MKKIRSTHRKVDILAAFGKTRSYRYTLYETMFSCVKYIRLKNAKSGKFEFHAVRRAKKEAGWLPDCYKFVVRR